MLMNKHEGCIVLIKKDECCAMLMNEHEGYVVLTMRDVWC